jgi:hypothetical protein
MRFTNPLIAYDEETGRFARSDILQLTNSLMKAKKKDNPWGVVKLCVDAFKKKYPKQYKSYVIRIKEVKDAQKSTWIGRSEFKGVSKDKTNDAYLAHTVDFPAWIMGLIRKVYNVNELKMDKEFFREFGKRFPEFRIMEKI